MKKSSLKLRLINNYQTKKKINKTYSQILLELIKVLYTEKYNIQKYHRILKSIWINANLFQFLR